MESNLRKEIEELRSVIGAKTDTATNARKSYQETREGLDQDQASLRRMEREIIESTEEIARIRDRVEVVRREKASLDVEHKAALDAFAKAEADERPIKGQYDAVKDDVTRARTDLTDLEAENERWAALLTELRHEIATLGTEHAGAMESANDYRQKVD